MKTDRPRTATRTCSLVGWLSIVLRCSFTCALVVVTSCGENRMADGLDIEVDDGSVRGELAVYMSDDSGGIGVMGETRYALRLPTGLERPLLFDHDMTELTPGADLKVWATETPAGLRVTSYRVIPPAVEERASALQSATALPDRSFAFVLIDLGGGVNITADNVMARMVNDATSVRNYYLYASYGRQNITNQVFGPFKASPLSTCGTPDTTNLANSLRAMIPGTFQHYLWYLGSKQPACPWAGLASVGTAAKPSRDTWYNAATGCVVLVQEPGHNFGMQHSSSIRCAGTPLADDTMTCAASEYGDPFDPMGSGCKHMNAWQKGYQGWFAGCNGVNVGSSGTFTILPFEMRCDGVQFLQIKAPKTRTIMRTGGGGMPTTETLDYYFVELRTPLDFDGTLGGTTSLTPRVLLHIANDIVAANKRAIHPYIIDMTPTTTTGSGAGFGDAALAVGQTFTDPAGGLSITATAVSATQATITVEIVGGTAAPTCLDDSAFVAPGAGPESCIANTATPVGAEPTLGAGGGAAGTSGGATGTGGRSASGGLPGTGGAAASGTGGSPSPGGGAALGTGGAPVGPGGVASETGGTGFPMVGGPAAVDAGPGAGLGPNVAGGCGCEIDSSRIPPSRTALALTALMALRFRRRSRERRVSGSSRGAAVSDLLT